MGCIFPEEQKTVSISKNIVSLLVSGQTEELIFQLKKTEGLNLNKRINFRGDTLLHYACVKNNIELVKYLV